MQLILLSGPSQAAVYTARYRTQSTLQTDAHSTPEKSAILKRNAKKKPQGWRQVKRQYPSLFAMYSLQRPCRRREAVRRRPRAVRASGAQTDMIYATVSDGDMIEASPAGISSFLSQSVAQRPPKRTYALYTTFRFRISNWGPYSAIIIYMGAVWDRGKAKCSLSGAIA